MFARGSCSFASAQGLGAPFRICGAIYVVQATWCKLCDVSFVVPALWCKVRGARYVA